MPEVKDAVRRNAFLATVIGWWRDRRAAGEGDSLSEAELVRIAVDLGLTRRDIELLAAEGAYADSLMRRMLASHHISALDLVETRPDLYDAMARRCADCTDQARCQRELDTGTAAENAAEFCPNAATLRGLVL